MHWKDCVDCTLQLEIIFVLKDNPHQLACKNYSSMWHLQVESGSQIGRDSTGRQNQGDDKVMKSQYDSSNETGHWAYNLLPLPHSPPEQAGKIIPYKPIMSDNIIKNDTTCQVKVS